MKIIQTESKTKPKHYIKIHCQDCPGSALALDEIQHTTLKSGRKDSRKTYLCNEHAVKRGYLNKNSTRKYICIEEYLKKERLKKDLTHPLIKDTQQTDIDDYI